MSLQQVEREYIPPILLAEDSNSSESVQSVESVQFIDKPEFKGRILVVDDQNFNIEALKIILIFCCKLSEDMIDVAMSGEVAINLVKENIL